MVLENLVQTSCFNIIHLHILQHPLSAPMIITYFVQCEKQTIYSSTVKKKLTFYILTSLSEKLLLVKNVSFSNIFSI